jgi:hypothetical protein
MTDEELNALVERLDYAAASDGPAPVDWHLTHLSIGDARDAASAIRQLMRERDEAREVLALIANSTGTDAELFADWARGRAGRHLAKHPPAPS